MHGDGFLHMAIGNYFFSIGDCDYVLIFGIFWYLCCFFTQLKAGIRTFNPREEQYMKPDPKFKISVSELN